MNNTKETMKNKFSAKNFILLGPLNKHKQSQTKTMNKDSTFKWLKKQPSRLSGVQETTGLDNILSQLSDKTYVTTILPQPMIL